MSDSFDKCESAIFGHAIANNFQASTYLGIEMGESLCALKHFDPTDVMSRYLFVFYTLEYPMGEIFRLVYEKLKSEIQTKKSKLSREHFRFSLDSIHNAANSAHNQVNGLSAGSNPAQRSYPLAFCPWIDDKDLFEISCQDAQLTNLSPQAGQVSGIVNLICRHLIKGNDWNDAIEYAFDNAPRNLSSDIREIQTRYKDDIVLNNHRGPAFAPNVLHTTLYCVTHSTSFADALKIASVIERDYCPTLVGLLAGARWSVPKSTLDTWNNDQMNRLKQISKCFIKEWRNLNGTNKSFIQRLFK